MRHVYIPAEDPAWDDDLVDADKEKMEAAGEDPDEHPVQVYWMGQSRYDIGAKLPVCGEPKSVMDYLKKDVPYTEFEMQPLKVRDFTRAQDLKDGTGNNQAWLFCVENGVTGVGDLPIPTRGDGKRRRLTSDGLEALGRMGLVYELGLAVFLLSAPVSDAEKKLFGS